MRLGTGAMAELEALEARLGRSAGALLEGQGVAGERVADLAAIVEAADLPRHRSAGRLLEAKMAAQGFTGKHDVVTKGGRTVKVGPVAFARMSAGGFVDKSKTSKAAQNALTASASQFDEGKHKRGTGAQGGQFVSKGASGDSVKGVQKRVGAKTDGKFGNMTAAAVKTFQKRRGLQVDGVVGAQTAAALLGDKAAAVGKLTKETEGRLAKLYAKAGPSTSTSKKKGSSTKSERIATDGLRALNDTGKGDEQRGRELARRRRRQAKNKATKSAAQVKPKLMEGEHAGRVEDMARRLARAPLYLGAGFAAEAIASGGYLVTFPGGTARHEGAMSAVVDVLARAGASVDPEAPGDGAVVGVEAAAVLPDLERDLRWARERLAAMAERPETEVAVGFALPSDAPERRAERLSLARAAVSRLEGQIAALKADGDGKDAEAGEVAEMDWDPLKHPKNLLGQWKKKTAGMSDVVVPEYDSSKLTFAGAAGGSNGARFANHADGSKWLVKTYGGNEDRVASELLANATYRTLGARVPQAGRIRLHNGKSALSYPLVDGKPKPGVFQGRGAKPSEALGRHFMADALLANWDVVGLEDDNILWDKAGQPFRVDQGGAFEFRAMGKPKPFGPVPLEVKSMMQGGGQARRAMAVDEGQLRSQAAEIGRVMTPAKIDALVDAAGFKDQAMADRLRKNLRARVAWMQAYAVAGAALMEDVVFVAGAGQLPYLLEAAVASFNFNDHAHPRDAYGKFRETLAGLTPKGQAGPSAVQLDSKTRVSRDADGTYRVVRSGKIHKGFEKASDAAFAAVNKSAKGTEADSVGGEKKTSLDALIAADGGNPDDMTLGGSGASINALVATKVRIEARIAKLSAGDKYEQRSVADYKARLAGVEKKIKAAGDPPKKDEPKSGATIAANLTAAMKASSAKPEVLGEPGVKVDAPAAVEKPLSPLVQAEIDKASVSQLEKWADGEGGSSGKFQAAAKKKLGEKDAAAAAKIAAHMKAGTPKVEVLSEPDGVHKPGNGAFGARVSSAGSKTKFEVLDADGNVLAKRTSAADYKYAFRQDFHPDKPGGWSFSKTPKSLGAPSEAGTIGAVVALTPDGPQLNLGKPDESGVGLPSVQQIENQNPYKLLSFGHDKDGKSVTVMHDKGKGSWSVRVGNDTVHTTASAAEARQLGMQALSGAPEPDEANAAEALPTKAKVAAELSMLKPGEWNSYKGVVVTATSDGYNLNKVDGSTEIASSPQAAATALDKAIPGGLSKPEVKTGAVLSAGDVPAGTKVKLVDALSGEPGLMKLTALGNGKFQYPEKESMGGGKIVDHAGKVLVSDVSDVADPAVREPGSVGGFKVGDKVQVVNGGATYTVKAISANSMMATIVTSNGKEYDKKVSKLLPVGGAPAAGGEVPKGAMATAVAKFPTNQHLMLANGDVMKSTGQVVDGKLNVGIGSGGNGGIKALDVNQAGGAVPVSLGQAKALEQFPLGTQVVLSIGANAGETQTVLGPKENGIEIVSDGDVTANVPASALLNYGTKPTPVNAPDAVSGSAPQTGEVYTLSTVPNVGFLVTHPGGAGSKPQVMSFAFDGKSPPSGSAGDVDPEFFNHADVVKVSPSASQLASMNDQLASSPDAAGALATLNAVTPGSGQQPQAVDPFASMQPGDSEFVGDSAVKKLENGTFNVLNLNAANSTQNFATGAEAMAFAKAKGPGDVAPVVPAGKPIKGPQENPAGISVAASNLEVGDVFQLKKGGQKLTVTGKTSSGGVKVKASSGKNKIVYSYATPYKVTKADGSKFGTASGEPQNATQAAAVPVKTPAQQIADAKGKLIDPPAGTGNLKSLPSGTVVGTPEGKVAVVAQDIPAYTGYVTLLDISTGEKIEAKESYTPFKLLTDPEGIVDAKAALAASQTATPGTVSVAPGGSGAGSAAVTGPPPAFNGVPANNAADQIVSKLQQSNSLMGEQGKAVKGYTNGEYGEINAALRNSKGIKSVAMAKKIAALKKAIADSKEFEQDVILSRKTSVAEWANADAGDVIHDNGFLSTSTLQGTWSGQIQLRILAPKGSKGLWVNSTGHSSHPGEHEVILPPGSQFEVLKKEKKSSSDTTTILYVRLIP
jgi:uncharacterized protein YodC (DUF2158 family)